MQARNVAATEAVFREAVAAGPSSTFFQHALFPHPCGFLPGPAAAGIQWWARDGFGGVGDGPRLSGDMLMGTHLGQA